MKLMNPSPKNTRSFIRRSTLRSTRWFMLLCFSSLTLMFASCASKTNNSDLSPTKTKEKARPLIDNSKEGQLNIPYRSLDTSKSIEIITVASGVNQNADATLWAEVAKVEPDLMIMAGNNVYLAGKDNKPYIDQYIKLNKIPEYIRLRETTPFLATWDEQDFGQIAGDKSNPDKEEARKLFLKYWGYLRPSLPPQQKALYHSRVIGSKNRQIQIILLDTRWDKSFQDKKLLSDEQWSWLETEIRKPSQIKLIITPLQVIESQSADESWDNYPTEKDKLFKLLKKSSTKKIVFVSSHAGKSIIKKSDIPNVGTLFELTTHAFTANGLGTEIIAAKTDTPASTDPSVKLSGTTDINFGLIKIEWPQKNVILEIKNSSNETKQEQKLKI